MSIYKSKAMFIAFARILEATFTTRSISLGATIKSARAQSASFLRKLYSLVCKFSSFAKSLTNA